jgi:hypothetical protein
VRHVIQKVSLMRTLDEFLVIVCSESLFPISRDKSLAQSSVVTSKAAIRGHLKTGQ